MTAKTTNRILKTLTVLVALIIILVTIFAWRSEGTREIVQRVDSPCARAAGPYALPSDVLECQTIRRQSVKDQPLSDACISQRKTLKTGWLERVTRCPPVDDGK